MDMEPAISGTLSGDTIKLGWIKDGLNVAPGGNVHLFKTGFVPSYQSLKADFVAHEADFSGYALVGANLYTGPFVDSDNKPFIRGIVLSWTSANPIPVTNSISGVWFEDTANNLLDYTLFDNPIQVVNPNQNFTVRVYYYADGSSRAEVVF